MARRVEVGADVLSPPLGTSTGKIIINLKNMFAKKKVVGDEIKRPEESAKVDPRFDIAEAKKGECETRPLVRVTKHTEQEDNKKPEVYYRIETRDHDVMRVSEEVLNALFVELAYKMDAEDVLHLLYVAHAREHKHEPKVINIDLGDFGKNMPPFLKDLLEGKV